MLVGHGKSCFPLIIIIVLADIMSCKNCQTVISGKPFYFIKCVCYAYFRIFVVVVALLFYVHSKHLRSCRDGQLT